MSINISLYHKSGRFENLKTMQKNFDTLKRLFYQAYYKSDIAAFTIVCETISKGKLLPHFNARERDFLADFNQWLDRLDIRSAGDIIDVLVKDGRKLPKWMERKQYTIEYNNGGMLDLIPIN